MRDVEGSDDQQGDYEGVGDAAQERDCSEIGLWTICGIVHARVEYRILGDGETKKVPGGSIENESDEGPPDELSGEGGGGGGKLSRSS